MVDMGKKIVYNGSEAHDRRIVLRDMPEDQKCDFRRDYESGKTLKDIAEKYCCDPRTVRRCILNNKSSSELGRQTAPTKLTEFMGLIDSMYCEIVSPVHQLSKPPGICEISRMVTTQIREKGYSGSERTVRNYLRIKHRFVIKEEE